VVVEQVNEFCTKKEYDIFMSQVNDYEHLLVQSNIYLIKLYFSITKEEQVKRFAEIQNNPLKLFKISLYTKSLKIYGTTIPNTNKKCLTSQIPKSLLASSSMHIKTQTPDWRAINYILEGIPHKKY